MHVFPRKAFKAHHLFPLCGQPREQSFLSTHLLFLCYFFFLHICTFLMPIHFFWQWSRSNSSHSPVRNLSAVDTCLGTSAGVFLSLSQTVSSTMTRQSSVTVTPNATVTPTNIHVTHIPVTLTDTASPTMTVSRLGTGSHSLSETDTVARASWMEGFHWCIAVQYVMITWN